MAIKINFDKNNNPIAPSMVLATRSGIKIGKVPANNIVIKDKLNTFSEISFNVIKTDCENFVNLDNSFVNHKLEKYLPVYQDYISICNKAGELGVDFSQAIYGNIDTNNRKKLQWTDENLTKYKTVWQSWDYEAIEDWDSFCDNLRGSYSTVYGGSENFDGIEIAFFTSLSVYK